MSDSASSKALHIESIFSISHDKDVDGLNAAAIVLRYARSKDLNHEVLLADYGAFEIIFSQVAVLRNALIIVTDLGMDDSVLEVIKSSLERAISQGCRLVWLDHHQWSEQAIKTILSLGNKPVLKINHDFCAAEIAFKVLMPRDAISSELATIAHDTDFNHRKIEGASALTDALSVIRFNAIAKREDMTETIRPLLVKLADEGLSGVWEDSGSRFKDSLLDKQVHNYRKERLKKMRKTLKGHCDQEIHERLVRIVEAPGGLTTTDLGTFLSNPENLQIGDENLAVADLLISMSPGGMLGFRRGRETVLCNAAAKLFNGGGHPYAAGGEYGLYEDFQAVCDDIFLTLSNSKDWIISSPEK
ncbi:MAG: DHH family phosphoesterase [Candidatus Thorarchaeota archaeon]|jgi:oligoribonuclease NrnB/cAMP/cGMP phosphodiesterase (DHH superfamily)